MRLSERRVREWLPGWWAGEGGTAGTAMDLLLWPAERLYAAATGARNRGYDAGLLPVGRSPVPVVSVGNLAVGGAGKTPVAAWIASRLVEMGRRPGVVLRGYGADEVLVHRELNPAVPVFPAPRRVAGAERAAAEGCDVVVLDDAFQHRALARDLDLVLVAAESWGSRRRLLPRGPWREGVAGLRRADGVVVTAKSATENRAAAVAAELRAAAPAARVVVCRLAPTRLLPLHADAGTPRPLEWLQGRAVLAVASLADPTPFAEQLRAAGARVELRAFPDHHPFSEQDARELSAAAGERPLVMTRKEAVKLRARVAPSAVALLLEQSVRFGADEDVMVQMLTKAIQ